MASQHTRSKFFNSKIGAKRAPSLTSKPRAQINAAKAYAAQALLRKKIAAAKLAAARRVVQQYQALAKKPHKRGQFFW